MIVIRVELWSAVTGKVSEIARMHICNTGGTVERGDYVAQTFKGRSSDTLSRRQIQRSGNVRDHPRLTQHVWNLVAKALKSMGYGDA
ncbi:hypothetical protein BSL82_05890 [Tardibacter chloracetimidivorans]|uniref:Uncharacterized protein n=1 Tax=Tardibacter chloracetimidivorans TaxID=1921510 RepID=A0A1L3ZTD3_9SPHN|nr:hypothetical protein [Tardibacter chloracetimidivorans]API58901.1 hypothetical protein BSL82_05890 [Tardibacter chloracetimidivorans]